MVFRILSAVSDLNFTELCLYHYAIAPLCNLFYSSLPGLRFTTFGYQFLVTEVCTISLRSSEKMFS